MLRATSLGLYEEVAAEVGLYDVLSLAVDGSGIPAGGSSAHDGQHADAATGQGFASAIGDTAPASPTPPLSTSSLSSPIPEPGADVSTGVLEPFVTDLISSDAEAGPQVESTGIAMQGDVQVEHVGASDGALAPLPAVIGLGALAWQLSLTQSLSSSAAGQGSGLLQPGDHSGGSGALWRDLSAPTSAMAGEGKRNVCGGILLHATRS